MFSGTFLQTLPAYWDRFVQSPIVIAVVVNGSFVTSKPHPEDIDLILVLSSDHDFSAKLRPFAYNVLLRRRVHRRYGFDLLVARENRSEYEEYTEFFQQVRGQPEARKGIVRIQL